MPQQLRFNPRPKKVNQSLESSIALLARQTGALQQGAGSAIVLAYVLIATIADRRYNLEEANENYHEALQWVLLVPDALQCNRG